MRRGSGNIESVECEVCRDFDFRLEIREGQTVLDSESVSDEELEKNVDPETYLSTEMHTQTDRKTCPNCGALTVVAIGADRGDKSWNF